MTTATLEAPVATVTPQTLETNIIVYGDALDYLRTMPDNSVDSVVTDPPYGISFMAKGWDTFSGNKEYAEWVETWAKECLRVLKPGGHLLAFSGTRTYHALAWGVESAGFEIRDMIEWLYLSGFPKSMDVGKQFDKSAGAEREIVGSYETHKLTAKPGGTGGSFIAEDAKGSVTVNVTAPATPLAQQWDGWGTALKPAHEPIVMARKPFDGTVCANVEQHGTGAVNVDGCRIGDGSDSVGGRDGECTADKRYTDVGSTDFAAKPGVRGGSPEGRFPANCVTADDSEWYSRYFNVAGVTNVSPQDVSKKASKPDRNATWDGRSISVEERVTTDGRDKPIDNPFNRGETLRSNHHPTVKPIALMEWLIRLVTPPSGLVLDPFAGSGTTLVAAKRQGYAYIGIEREIDYIQIAEQRLETGAAELAN